MILLFLINQLLHSFAYSEKVFLLDTTKESNLNWLRYKPNSDLSDTQNGWLEESYSHEDSNGAQIIWRSYVVCDMNDPSISLISPRDNWLRTPRILLQQPSSSFLLSPQSPQSSSYHENLYKEDTRVMSGLRRIYIELTYSMRDCIGRQDEACKETFEVYYAFTSSSHQPHDTNTNPIKLKNHITTTTINNNNNKDLNNEEDPFGKSFNIAIVDNNNSYNKKKETYSLIHDTEWYLLDKVAASSTQNINSPYFIHNITTAGSTEISKRTLSFSINATTWPSFYIAFRDTGACLSLLAIKIYTLYCRGGIFHDIWVNDTPTSSQMTSVVTAKGICLPHSTYTNKLEMINVDDKAPPPFNPNYINLSGLLCKSDGNWLEPFHDGNHLKYHSYKYNKSCLCNPGYQYSNKPPIFSKLNLNINNGKFQLVSICQVCRPGTYKHSYGNFECSICPENSESLIIGSKECKCKNGYFKLKSIFYADTSCQKPPSAVLNLNVIDIEPDCVLLSWSAPTFHLPDISTKLQLFPISYKITFGSYIRYINNTWIKIEKLNSSTEYYFHVYSLNIISNLAGYSNFADIKIKTPHKIKNKVKKIDIKAIHKDEIFISWVIENLNEKDNFDIAYFPSNISFNLFYKIINTNSYNITINGLQSNTEYAIKIRMREIDAVSKYSREYYFKMDSSQLLYELNKIDKSNAKMENPGTLEEKIDFYGNENGNLPRNQMTIIITVFVISIILILSTISFITFFVKKKLRNTCKNRNSSDCDSLEIRQGPEDETKNNMKYGTLIMKKNKSSHVNLNTVSKSNDSKYGTHKECSQIIKGQSMTNMIDIYNQHTYEEPQLFNSYENDLPKIEFDLILIGTKVLIAKGYMSHVYRALMCSSHKSVPLCQKSKGKKLNELKFVLNKIKIPDNINSINTLKGHSPQSAGCSLKTVAIKFLRQSKTFVSGDDEKRFYKEAKLLVELSNSHFPIFLGILKCPEKFLKAYVMEFIENGNLDEFLKINETKVTVYQLFSIILKICEGMKYLHEKYEGVAHKRLRAQNILLDKELNPKIISLSSYTATTSTNRDEIETDLDGIYGTIKGNKILVRWTPPEIFCPNISGIDECFLNQDSLAFHYNMLKSQTIFSPNSMKCEFNEFSDIWSYGIVCWEVFGYGERPYCINWSNSHILYALKKGYRLPPPMYCPEIIHELMLLCWHKEIEKRPTFSKISKIMHKIQKNMHVLDIPAFIKSINYDPFGVRSFISIEDWLNSIKLGHYKTNFESLKLFTIPHIFELLNITEHSKFSQSSNNNILMEESDSMAYLLNALSITNTDHRRKIVTILHSLQRPFINNVYEENISLMKCILLKLNQRERAFNEYSKNILSSNNSLIEIVDSNYNAALTNNSKYIVSQLPKGNETQTTSLNTNDANYCHGGFLV